MGYFVYERYSLHITEQEQALTYIATPKVDDIYFFDLSNSSESLASKNKYKLAKVVRVTDDNVVLVFGAFFYQWQYAVVSSIQYGELRNNNYFTSTLDYISFKKIKEMYDDGNLYLVKRPIGNKLYGSLVVP